LSSHNYGYIGCSSDFIEQFVAATQHFWGKQLAMDETKKVVQELMFVGMKYEIWWEANEFCADLQ
jgi:hypothetical protein